MKPTSAMKADAPEGLQENVALGARSTLGTGGSARFFFTASDVAGLRTALVWARDQGLETLVLGGGSNIVCADAGFPGLVIQCALTGVEVELNGSSAFVTAHAGENWDSLVAHTVSNDWAGLECLSGIPGRVGATPIQNVGAYGQEVSDTIVEVHCLDRECLQELRFSNSDCAFTYRDSRFKGRDCNRFVVTAVRFRLTVGGQPLISYGDLRHRLRASAPTLQQVRDAVLSARREKSMVLDVGDPNGRSCGSFFLNPIVSRAAYDRLSNTHGDMPRYDQLDGSVKLAAAWLIERAGFRKGDRRGAVGLSTKHALAIVAHDGATSEDVRRFAMEIKASVRKAFDIELQAEPRFIGFSPP